MFSAESVCVCVRLFVCVCVSEWCLTVKPLCPPLLSLFHESLDHNSERKEERERERGERVCVWERERMSVCVCVCVREREDVCVCVCVRVKSTQGLSKWFKRDVRGLQHMVGSDFLMQIGKDQIKAAWQPINQPSNQTWQLSIMAPSSPRNSIVRPQIVYLIPRKEKKAPEVELFFFFFCPLFFHPLVQKKLCARIKCVQSPSCHAPPPPPLGGTPRALLTIQETPIFFFFNFHRVHFFKNRENVTASLKSYQGDSSWKQKGKRKFPADNSFRRDQLCAAWGFAKNARLLCTNYIRFKKKKKQSSGR